MYEFDFSNFSLKQVDIEEFIDGLSDDEKSMISDITEQEIMKMAEETTSKDLDKTAQSGIDTIIDIMRKQVYYWRGRKNPKDGTKATSDENMRANIGLAFTFLDIKRIERLGFAIPINGYRSEADMKMVKEVAIRTKLGSLNKNGSDDDIREKNAEIRASYASKNVEGDTKVFNAYVTYLNNAVNKGNLNAAKQYYAKAVAKLAQIENADKDKAAELKIKLAEFESKL